jgi:hypothetical protein
MKSSHCSNIVSLICCQVLIPIHQNTPLLKGSLTLSGLQEGWLMSCLLHLLCESARPNKDSSSRKHEALPCGYQQKVLIWIGVHWP